mmetsp:Transcript_55427/g.131119  ORF Transcript_55427/g.131119 Transcript_55427/m.131119 type:complete len:379 (-) Transcript_55427:101-1237(-)
MGEEEPDGQSAKIQKLWDAFIENNQNWFMATVVFVTMVLVGNKLLGLNSPKKAKGGAAPARKPSSQKAHGPKKDAKGSQKDKAVASPASVADATPVDPEEEATEKKVVQSTGWTPYLIIAFTMFRVMMVFVNPKAGGYQLSTTDLQPLMTTTEYFLPPKALAAMQQGVSNHPLTGKAQGIFSQPGTEGFTVAFDHRGIEVFEESRELSALRLFFERARVSDCNAFELSLVVSRGSKDAEDGSDIQDLEAVRTHLSAFSTNSSARQYVAYQTDIYWVHVPEGASGGELHLYSYKGGTPSGAMLEKPDATVAPETNTVAHVRGDAFQRIMAPRGAAARRGDATVAVVLDQYIVKEEILAKSPPFTLTSSRRRAVDEASEA